MNLNGEKQQTANNKKAAKAAFLINE